MTGLFAWISLTALFRIYFVIKDAGIDTIVLYMVACIQNLHVEALQQTQYIAFTKFVLIHHSDC